jgi:uracil-DNA glycosylase
VRPALIVALGTTATRGVLRRTVTIARARTVTERLADGTQVRVTIHPSLLLRLQPDAERSAEYNRFVADLRGAATLAETAIEQA